MILGRAIKRVVISVLGGNMGAGTKLLVPCAGTKLLVPCEARRCFHKTAGQADEAVNSLKDTERYKDAAKHQLYTDLAPGYINYGMIRPEDPPEMTFLEANEAMVDYIIKELGITEESNVLDLGCGTGMYLVQIAKKTGCRYVGTDLMSNHIEICEKTAEEHGVGDQGEFHRSSWEEPNESVYSRKFTHVTSMGCMFYGHYIIDKILTDITRVSDKSTKIFIWDIQRNAPWDVICAGPNRHLQLTNPMITPEIMTAAVAKSPLELVKYEDFTENILRPYDIFAEEALKRDPEQKNLTYPLMRDAYYAGTLKYVIFNLKLRHSIM